MKPMKTRLLILITLALVVFLSSFAGAQEKRDVTLSLWTHDGLYVEFFTNRQEEFAAMHPDINFTFDFQIIPDLPTVVLANLAAGEPIGDMIGIEQGWFPRFMQDDIIHDTMVDLTPLIGDKYNMVTEGRHTPFSSKGKVFGVDSSISAFVYFYQPAVFDLLGETVPTTWDEALATGAKMFADYGVHMFLIPNSGDHMMSYFNQRGAHIFDVNGNFVLGEEENYQRALEVLNLFREGIDNGTFKTFAGGDFWGASPITDFREGTGAGSIMPDWYGDYVLKLQAEDMAGDWRIAQMPSWDDGTGGPTATWGGTGFGAWAGSENAELATEFILNGYYTIENQLKRFEEIGYFPTMPAAFDDPRVAELSDPYFGGQKIGAVFRDISPDVPIWYQSVFRPAYQDKSAADMPLFYDGTLSAEEFLDGIIEYVEEEIEFSQ